MSFTRRDTMAGALALAASACSSGTPDLAPALPAASPTGGQTGQSLATLARAKGLRFGSTAGAGSATSGSFRNLEYAALVQQDCNVLVPENELKWQAIRPSPTTFDFTRFDEILAFADAKNLATRGHTLLWHRPQWMPAWAETYNFGSTPATAAAQLLETHIATVCKRYAGHISSFDVVNETVLPEDGMLSQTALSRAFGNTQDMLDFAFRTARTHAPAAQLVYNDYMSWEPGNEKHRAGVLKLLEGFKARNIPVDALGIQSHIRVDSIDPATGTAARQETAWRQFLDAIVGMGYGLIITVFDVNDQALPASIAARDRAVADYGRAYLDLMLSYRQLKDILVWGLCDRYSWLQQFQPLRSDGLPKRCCPYDADFKPKLLHAEIAAALTAAAPR